MGPNQTYKLLYSKGNHKKKKRKPTEWEKIFANDATDKGSYNSTTKKPKQPNQKMGRTGLPW